MNTLPTEESFGNYYGRQTRLDICPCGCGQPVSIFIDDNAICDEQTQQLRFEVNKREAKALMKQIGLPFGGFGVYNPITGKLELFPIEPDNQN